MTHPSIDTKRLAAIRRAWTEVCQTIEGRQEYVRRFGDYLFPNPPRETPPELFSPPPPALRPRTSRQHKPRADVPDGLKTAAQAATKLGCSIKTLNGYVETGALKYVALGHGRKRRRRSCRIHHQP